MSVASLGGAQGNGQRMHAFSRLFSITLANRYFNQPEVGKNAIAISPTRKSAQDMAACRLLTRSAEGTIEVIQSASEALINALKGGAASKAEWTKNQLQSWLSFTASATDPAFFQYSDIPFDFDPRSMCFYLSNLQDPLNFDVRADGAVSLIPSDHIDMGISLPKVAGTERRSFPDGCNTIELRNVLDHTVQCFPRFVPAGLLATMPADQIDCEAVAAYSAQHPGEALVERSDCVIYFGREPAGMYTLCYVGASQDDEAVVYPADEANCLCFIDIVLADPTSDAGGVFPVADLFDLGEPTISNVDFFAEFEARSAFWNYILVPPQGEELLVPQFSDQNGNTIAFGSPTKVTVPGGMEAVSICSLDSYPLQNKPTFWMEVQGRIKKDNAPPPYKSVSISALPTPNPAQMTALSNSSTHSRSTALEGGHQTSSSNKNIGVANIYVYL